MKALKKGGKKGSALVDDLKASLEKEKKELKQHEDFYINKAREWKTWALKYEKILKNNNITYEFE